MTATAAIAPPGRSSSLTVLCWTDSPTPHDPQVVSLARSAKENNDCAVLQCVRKVLRSIVDADDAASVHLSRDDVILINRLHYMLKANQTLQKLRESQAKLAHAQRIAHLGNWEWDAESNELNGLVMKSVAPTLYP